MTLEEKKLILTKEFISIICKINAEQFTTLAKKVLEALEEMQKGLK